MTTLDHPAPKHPQLGLLGESRTGVLATVSAAGRPHLSTVNHTIDPVTDEIVIGISASSAKARNLRRDPRVSYHVISADSSSWVVAEGTAVLGPTAADPRDAVADEFVRLYPLIWGGDPVEDEEAFRAVVVTEGHQVLRFGVERVYGWPGAQPGPR
jgi:PPOX class probable F420-dependent enzyme